MSRRLYGVSRNQHVNEISDEAQHEISAAIHASARQSIRPYNSQDEYLFAMKEDLSEWLAILHSESINEYSFFRKLESGILLCKHANTVTLHAEEFQISNPHHPILNQLKVPQNQVRFNEGKHVKAESFFARDNVAQFINYCRIDLSISDTIMFETEDLVLRKNEKNFILTLLEVARRGAKFGMEAPTIIKMELEIDREMALDNGEELSSDEEQIYEPEQQQQKVAADFKSLDEMVQYYLGQCSCPTMFTLRKVGDGKYQIGNSKALIYMRILRNHVMVRVGGGWDTLENYLNKHDPCRCNRHRVEKHMKSTNRLNQTLSPAVTNRLRGGETKRARSSLGGSASLSRSTPQLAQTTLTTPRRKETTTRKETRKTIEPVIKRPLNDDINYAPTRTTKLRGAKSISNLYSTGSSNEVKKQRSSPSRGISEVLGVAQSKPLTPSKSLGNLSSSQESNSPGLSVFDRLYANKASRRPKSDSFKNDIESCINVERRSTGHVINGRSTTASPAPSGTSTRSSSARSRSTSHEMSRTLPSSFTQRRARPLRDENSSPSPASSGRRSQTPSRQKARMTTVQSTPKSKPDAPPRTRRLTANEATYKSARSRESSSERILDDKTSTRNRSRSYEPKSQRDLKQLIVDDDVELTLDDLETKINVYTHHDINHAHHEHEQAFRDLSLSFGERKVKPRPDSRPGSSRSRIPIPTSSSRIPRPSSAASSLASMERVNAPVLSSSQREQHNYSPDRADSGIDIYAEFETSPTNSIRRALRAQQAQYQRPPDIIE